MHASQSHLLVRRVELYDMDWVHKDGGQGIGLDQFMVSVAPFGGAIGTYTHDGGGRVLGVRSRFMRGHAHQVKRRDAQIVLVKGTN